MQLLHQNVYYYFIFIFTYRYFYYVYLHLFKTVSFKILKDYLKVKN